MQELTPAVENESVGSNDAVVLSFDRIVFFPVNFKANSDSPFGHEEYFMHFCSLC